MRKDVFTFSEPAELIGYASSAVLLLTILFQIHRQWASGTSKGVSVWLFVGQLAASVGFTAYSAAVDNTVFVFTNAALALAAVVGIVIVLVHKRRERRSIAEESRSDLLARAYDGTEGVAKHRERAFVSFLRER